MAFCKITNTSQGSLSLPNPFRGVLAPSQTIVVELSVAEVQEALTGDSAVAPRGLQVTALPATYAGPASTFYTVLAPTAVVAIVAPGEALPENDVAAFVTTVGGVASLPLPEPVPGRQGLVAKTNTDTNKITLVRHGSEQINGVSADYDLPGSELAQIGRWHFICDPSGNWWVG